MSITMYSASVPVLVRALENLQHVLKKGEAHAEAKKIAPEVLLHTRLTPDMFPLVRQVQIATDMAKGAAARLAERLGSLEGGGVDQRVGQLGFAEPGAHLPVPTGGWASRACSLSMVCS